MTSVKMVKLEDCCSIISGSTPKTGVSEYWDGDINWATPKDLSKLNQKELSCTAKKITQKGYDSCSTQMLPIKSVLLSSRAPIGLVAINTIEMCTNQGFKNLVPKKDMVLAEYLYYWLKTKKDYLQGLGNGATFKEISKSTLAKVEIPLVPLEEQSRIVDVLNEASALILKRKESIKLLDDYIASTFIEMFGDPISNPKNWEKHPLKEFGSIITGNTPPRSDDDNFSTNYIEWIKTDNIIESETYITKASEYLSEKGLAKSRYVLPGAVLIACIAGSSSSIGKVALTDRKVSFNQQINAIQPNNNVNQLYLYWLIKISKKYILSHATSGMKKILTKGAMQKIIMILPPLDIQNNFAERAKLAQDLKLIMLSQSLELDEQYQALVQKAYVN
jgi:type I restriction enzyme S subunit